MRISLETELLGKAGEKLRLGAEELTGLMEQLNRLMPMLEQEAQRGGEAALSRWEQAKRLAAKVSEAYLQFSEALRARTEAFVEADQAYGAAVEQPVLPAVILFRALGLGAETLILPVHGLSPGVISDPLSAVHAVWLKSKNEDSPSSSGASRSSASHEHSAPVLMPTDGGRSEKVVPLRNRKQLLREAALNPQVWSFANPAAGL
ncbi:hypothetical protein DCC85_09355 [Paenibacillus sp. CAA11]|uniref:WXG100 family type VII secretion target n=1 Tax=Paenibacillus sp. CAA11 TaxID=1532905 RepID=UPI000D35B112|nr:hypothetical protein [Paenibacillus sp. CAA11]AWB44413.1 hypothetical protein DCC85_09355 [Paenibacillus sp. CAA11]